MDLICNKIYVGRVIRALLLSRLINFFFISCVIYTEDVEINRWLVVYHIIMIRGGFKSRIFTMIN